MVFPHFYTLHITSLITFLTLFLKILGLQGKVPTASAGSWFQSWMFLFPPPRFMVAQPAYRSLECGFENEVNWGLISCGDRDFSQASYPGQLLVSVQHPA
jgi:hypothetical protein